MLLGARGGWLGVLLLGTLAWGQSEVAFTPLAVDGAGPKDVDLERYLAPYREGVEAFSSEVLGYAAEPLSRSRPECGLSNLVADSLRAVGAKEFEAEVDLAVTNFGGLRRDLPKGPLTMGLIAELSPFENYLAYLVVKGDFVLELARQANRGVALSGIEVKLSEDGDVLEALVNGEPIQRNKRYRVVSIDYLASTYGSLFREEWIVEKRVSKNLVQRDAIVLHLSELTAAGVKVFDRGEGRVEVVSGEQ